MFGGIAKILFAIWLSNVVLPILKKKIDYFIKRLVRAFLPLE